VVEILSDMKLTHLAVDYCLMLPTEKNKQSLIDLFQKCTRLLALECNTVACSTCAKFIEKNISVLSHHLCTAKCLSVSITKLLYKRYFPAARSFSVWTILMIMILCRDWFQSQIYNRYISHQLQLTFLLLL